MSFSFDATLDKPLREVTHYMLSLGFIPESHKEMWGNNRVAVTFKKADVSITVIFDTQENKALVIEGRRSNATKS